MRRFLKKLFDSSGRGERSSAAAVMASEDLGRIEKELEKTPTGYAAARLYNRAGDLYLVKGDRENALKRYGDAIDAYLHAGEYDNAMAVCRKIIRVVPEVIRTRRTLAWLCLGKGFLEIAREHIEAYAAASEEAGLESLAIQHLLLMAQYVDRPDFRSFLADKLEELGDKDGAKRVREGEASEGVKAAGWTPVVFAAMLTPEELRKASERGVEIIAPTASKRSDDLDALLFDPDVASARAGSGSESVAETVKTSAAEKVEEVEEVEDVEKADAETEGTPGAAAETSAAGDEPKAKLETEADEEETGAEEPAEEDEAEGEEQSAEKEETDESKSD